ncbi:hypothetical protein E3N88_00041 [Mikania micrantha]|uniref:Uncharacterized protein n=1 Tax=Mikania micrantha TaxID=192012 RepID=A0A5N6PWY6_9ASTR|nr:hypothetical protein E3N88_00041 [Mikania micrantha]
MARLARTSDQLAQAIEPQPPSHHQQPPLATGPPPPATGPPPPATGPPPPPPAATAGRNPANSGDFSGEDSGERNIPAKRNIPISTQKSIENPDLIQKLISHQIKYKQLTEL